MFAMSLVEQTGASQARTKLIREVRSGLGSRPRSLKPWMFYDDSGSRLFEHITELPEYYPTRLERSLLEEHADAIIASVSDCAKPLRIIELGAGSATKTCLLLRSATRRRLDVVYVPLDVSADALDCACWNIGTAFPQVSIEPVVVNYVDSPPRLARFDGSTLALYLGTSIGNFSPDEARTILGNLASQLDTNDALLLGTDLVKDESAMVAAYDDGDGVTAAFNLNILNRLNKELGADFTLTSFRHRVFWNSRESRIEMHLESTCPQYVQVPAVGLELAFRNGETIHTENSYKFTDRTLCALLSDSGFRVDTTWSDANRWYALTLSRKSEVKR
jgi:L-histidine Nalpha-methyltransferase